MLAKSSLSKMVEFWIEKRSSNGQDPLIARIAEGISRERFTRCIPDQQVVSIKLNAWFELARVLWGGSSNARRSAKIPHFTGEPAAVDSRRRAGGLHECLKPSRLKINRVRAGTFQALDHGKSHGLWIIDVE